MWKVIKRGRIEVRNAARHLPRVLCAGILHQEPGHWHICQLRAAMRRDDVLHILRKHKTELEQFGVVSLAVFGSVARDEAGPESDIDILVEFVDVATFDRYMGLKIYLEDLLGVPIDLATRRALKPRVRPAIEREAIYVA